MAFLTGADLVKYIHSYSPQQRQSLLQRKDLISDARLTRKTTLYIAHSTYDQQHLYKAIVFLYANFPQLYIDYKEPAENVFDTHENQNRIKEKVILNGKLILLASAEGMNDPLLQWELGFADACKYKHDIALMPLCWSEKPSKYTDHVKLYSHLNFVDNELVVQTPKGETSSFAQWLITDSRQP